MATMTFYPFLQDFLNENGIIYTVRRFLYEPPSGMVYIPGVGGCKRELVFKDVVEKDLQDYYLFSGFQTREDWWDKIQEINKNYKSSKLYLYRITKVR